MRALIGRYLAGFVFLLALIPGLTMTAAVHYASERRLQLEFERSADLAIDRVISRLEQHVVVLRATHGLFSSKQRAPSREEFQRFLAPLDITGELAGIQGIGFARMLPADASAPAMEELRIHYGLSVAIRPETDQPWRTPIVLLEPQNPRNTAALGFDMYAEPTRRSAMDHAIASGKAQMSGPVELVQEITEDKQKGFLVYVPINAFPDSAQTSAAPVTGFVYAPFRGRDLIQAALGAGPALPVQLRVVDTGAPSTPLYDAIVHHPEAQHPHLIRTAELLGRQWQFEVHSLPPEGGLPRYADGLLLGLVSLLFAIAAAYGVASRQAEAVQARALANAAAREAQYRALSLQEMKHRIKNHIARIQSIARQSARSAPDLKSFITAFESRLHAMAALQDILAGNATAGANLRDILTKELQQTRDTTQIEAMLSGPTVILDERRAHAFALAVHELVTNAMKYGGLSCDECNLKVRWDVHTTSGGTELQMDWEEAIPEGVETTEKPAGFGSRLIEASINGELSGRIERTFTPERLHIQIRFPLPTS